MTDRSQGTCLCQAVRFEVQGEFDRFYLCHCSRCRKGTGSAHGANLFAPGARVTWLSGEEMVRHYELPGTRHTRSFCARCGSALPRMMSAEGMVIVPAGSLDSPVTVKPTAHICMASRAAWEDGLRDAPRFDGLPA
jgi:hypothetical protein